MKSRDKWLKYVISCGFHRFNNHDISCFVWWFLGISAGVQLKFVKALIYLHIKLLTFWIERMLQDVGKITHKERKSEEHAYANLDEWVICLPSSRQRAKTPPRRLDAPARRPLRSPRAAGSAPWAHDHVPHVYGQIEMDSLAIVFPHFGH